MFSKQNLPLCHAGGMPFSYFRTVQAYLRFITHGVLFPGVDRWCGGGGRRCAVFGPLSSFKCQLEVLHPVLLVLLVCSL